MVAQRQTHEVSTGLGPHVDAGLSPEEPASRRMTRSHLKRFQIEEPTPMNDAAAEMRLMVDDVYRSESRRVFATLIRLLGDFDLAEDALHDAFAAAVEQWTRDGVPDNPRAWLVSTGRFKAIDGMRRRARFDKSLAVLAEQLDTDVDAEFGLDDEGIEDDRLRSKKGATAMRFMILIKADKTTEEGVMPDEQLLTEMGKYNEELVNAGV
ncbi:MAG: polymerase sigma-70 factor, subfamily, partial [Thermomicrobiales bacterium]|nr:polymerase sigma-70 factor, subfamily [Thermomicrobiales bacterium]